MPEIKIRKMGRLAVISKANDLCVRSQAGVIKSTKCINAFACLGCSLDKRGLTNF